MYCGNKRIPGRLVFACKSGYRAIRDSLTLKNMQVSKYGPTGCAGVHCLFLVDNMPSTCKLPPIRLSEEAIISCIYC